MADNGNHTTARRRSLWCFRQIMSYQIGVQYQSTIYGRISIDVKNRLDLIIGDSLNRHTIPLISINGNGKLRRPKRLRNSNLGMVGRVIERTLEGRIREIEERPDNYIYRIRLPRESR